MQQSKSSRLAYFLGELRREMNGAVVGGMRFYGVEYGLNYGVSIATIRNFARQEKVVEEHNIEDNHKFSKLLYQQDVRELRLAALWMADSQQLINNNELDFWAKGIINSEIAEEAAFALLHRCDITDKWLDSDVVLLQYCSIMAIAKRCEGDREMAGNYLINMQPKLLLLIQNEPHILPKAIVSMLDTAIKAGVSDDEIAKFVNTLKQDHAATNFISEEVAWRLEFR